MNRESIKKSYKKLEDIIRNKEKRKREDKQKKYGENVVKI